MCECRQAVNERLAVSNSRIAVGFCLTTEGTMRGMELTPPMIVLEKVDGKKRGKPPTLLASCCPFCGDRYPTAS